MASGLNGQQFRFLGYLPSLHRARAALQAIEREIARGRDAVLHRDALSQRRLCLTRFWLPAGRTRVTVAIDLTGNAEYVQTRPVAGLAIRARPRWSAGPVSSCCSPSQPAAPARPAPRTPFLTLDHRQRTEAAVSHAGPPRHAPVAGSYQRRPCVAHIRNSAPGSKTRRLQSSSIATCAHRVKVGDDDPVVPHANAGTSSLRKLTAKRTPRLPSTSVSEAQRGTSSKSAAMHASPIDAFGQAEGTEAASCSRGWGRRR